MSSGGGGGGRRGAAGSRRRFALLQARGRGELRGAAAGRRRLAAGPRAADGEGGREERGRGSGLRRGPRRGFPVRAGRPAPRLGGARRSPRSLGAPPLAGYPCRAPSPARPGRASRCTGRASAGRGGSAGRRWQEPAARRTSGQRWMDVDGILRSRLLVAEQPQLSASPPHGGATALSAGWWPHLGLSPVRPRKEEAKHRVIAFPGLFL